MTRLRDDALARLAALPGGTVRGRFGERSWTVTVKRSADGRQAWLWGEELGGRARVSANVYHLAAGSVLKPCEMPAEDVIAFLCGFEPDPSA